MLTNNATNKKNVLLNYKIYHIPPAPVKGWHPMYVLIEAQRLVAGITGGSCIRLLSASLIIIRHLRKRFSKTEQLISLFCMTAVST